MRQMYKLKRVDARFSGLVDFYQQNVRVSLLYTYPYNQNARVSLLLTYFYKQNARVSLLLTYSLSKKGKSVPRRVAKHYLYVSLLLRTIIIIFFKTIN